VGAERGRKVVFSCGPNEWGGVVPVRGEKSGGNEGWRKVYLLSEGKNKQREKIRGAPKKHRDSKTQNQFRAKTQKRGALLLLLPLHREKV